MSLRESKDLVDVEKIVRYIELLQPFWQDSQLLNVVAGVHASPSVNVVDAKSMGKKILKDMEGKEIEKCFRLNGESWNCGWEIIGGDS